MAILIVPIIIGAYSFALPDKLDCAKDAVPVIVDNTIAGIV